MWSPPRASIQKSYKFTAKFLSILDGYAPVRRRLIRYNKFRNRLKAVIRNATYEYYHGRLSESASHCLTQRITIETSEGQYPLYSAHSFALVRLLTSI